MKATLFRPRAGAQPAVLPEKPRATVVIPHLNTPELLIKCLQSVAAQRLDSGWFEIIVVDNGSRVPPNVVAAAWPGVKFLEEREPGPGPARNLGVLNAQADVLVFTDADCRVGPGWLLTAIRAIERVPMQPCGGDVRIDFKNPKDIEGIEAFEAVFGFRQKMYVKRKQFSVTANMACSRKVFDAVGPFAGIGKAEDLDWGQRAAAAGMRMRYVPRMRVFHPARLTVGDLEKKWSRFIAHNWNRAKGSLKGRIKWQLSAFGVLASPFFHIPQLLLSSRTPTLLGRARGIGVMFKIRWYRFREMQKVALGGGATSAMHWNRA